MCDTNNHDQLILQNEKQRIWETPQEGSSHIRSNDSEEQRTKPGALNHRIQFLQKTSSHFSISRLVEGRRFFHIPRCAPVKAKRLHAYFW